MGGLCFILFFLGTLSACLFFFLCPFPSLSNNFPSPTTPPLSLPSSTQPWPLALSVEAHPWFGRNWSKSLLCLLNDGWTGKLRIQVQHSCFYSGVSGWREKGEFLSIFVITICLTATALTFIQTCGQPPDRSAQ